MCYVTLVAYIVFFVSFVSRQGCTCEFKTLIFLLDMFDMLITSLNASEELPTLHIAYITTQLTIGLELLIKFIVVVLYIKVKPN